MTLDELLCLLDVWSVVHYAQVDSLGREVGLQRIPVPQVKDPRHAPLIALYAMEIAADVHAEHPELGRPLLRASRVLISAALEDNAGRHAGCIADHRQRQVEVVKELLRLGAVVVDQVAGADPRGDQLRNVVAAPLAVRILRDPPAGNAIIIGNRGATRSALEASLILIHVDEVIQDLLILALVTGDVPLLLITHRPVHVHAYPGPGWVAEYPLTAVAAMLDTAGKRLHGLAVAAVELVMDVEVSANHDAGALAFRAQVKNEGILDSLEMDVIRGASDWQRCCDRSFSIT